MSDSSEEENEFTGDGDDLEEDVNGISPLEKRRSSSKPISYKDDDDEEMEDVGQEDESDDSDDSDDDDVPLAKLVQKKASPKKKSNGSTSKSKKRPVSSPKKKATVAAVNTNSNKSYEFASAALYGTECDKGLLIQRLLCRWWYAYTWPTDDIVDKAAPSGYDALEGFPGVFVCTGAGHADVGKILDQRDKDTAPTFRNFAAKPASELRDMLLTALTEQTKQLDENDTTARKELASLQKWAKAMDTTKADKDAVKILKAHSLF